MTRKLLLILLLFCFQTHTLAAMVAPCPHGGGGDMAAAHSCHQPAAAEQGGTDLPHSPGLDCWHCQLGCAFGVTALPMAPSLVVIPDGGAVSGNRAPQHFYRFIPDPLQRPPISVRA